METDNSLDPLEQNLRRLFAAEPDPNTTRELDSRLPHVLSADRRHSVTALPRFPRTSLWLRGPLVATSVLLVVVAIASIAGRIVGNESQTTIIRESGGYSADDAPQAAATFPDNDLILIGTVLRIEPARWSDGDHDHGHIFTPVVLSVEEVLRGSYGFDSITVQSLGGTVNGVGMLFTDAVSLADAPVGATLILFLTERAPGRDLPRAPNMAYAVDEGLATSLSAEQHRIEVEDFKELIRQARPSGGA